MNLTIEFNKPAIKDAFDWQLRQEINVYADNGEVIAKAEIELITINKHRGATESLALLEAQETTDWALPLSLYFKGQNLVAQIAGPLHIKTDANAKTHILLEALSVLPAYRKQGVASYLLHEIARHHAKAQSISALSMAMNNFVDLEHCETPENTAYYQSLNLPGETMSNQQLLPFFVGNGFVKINLDQSALAAPLPFEIVVASPQSILNSAN